MQEQQSGGSSAASALIAGIAVSGLAFGVLAVLGGLDLPTLLSAVLRLVHILAAAIWMGMIVFVNTIQIPALAATEPAGRAVLMTRIVPQVAASFRHTSHLTLLSGLLLLIPTGYVGSALVYGAAFEMPFARSALMIIGATGGLAMWAIVHFGIAPRIKVLTGQQPADDAKKASARAGVIKLARLNLFLMLPVTTLMMAAAHMV